MYPASTDSAVIVAEVAVIVTGGDPSSGTFTKEYNIE
jgi:hypothetical protein